MQELIVRVFDSLLVRVSVWTTFGMQKAVKNTGTYLECKPFCAMWRPLGHLEARVGTLVAEKTPLRLLGCISIIVKHMFYICCILVWEQSSAQKEIGSQFEPSALSLDHVFLNCFCNWILRACPNPSETWSQG